MRKSERIIEFGLLLSSLISVLVTFGIILVLMLETFSFFQEVSFWEFFTGSQWTPMFSEKHFGVLPLLSGTLLTSFIALLVAAPLGIIIAVYLSEYSSSWVRKTVKPFLELLAALPTVVYGYFALLFVTPLLQNIFPSMSGFNALAPGIVMGIMILPIVSSLSEDALHAVPKTLREAAYALGSTRLQTAFRVVIPAAASGIGTALILAVARAIGETMIVAIAAGQQAKLTFNPLESVQTMTAYIVQMSLGDVSHGSLEYKTIFAVAMALFSMTFVLNTIGYFLKKRFKHY